MSSPRLLQALLLAALAASPAAAKEVTAKVDVGLGPAAYLIGEFGDEGYGGAVYDDQAVHTGLRLSIAAVLDEEFAKRHPRLIPKKYRKHFSDGREILFAPGPLALIPKWLMISPRRERSGLYGATWQLFGAGVGIGNHPVRFGLGGGVIVTYAFLHSTAFRSPTHFLRPGLNLNAELRFTLSSDRRWLASVGWDSQIYVPQAVGGGIFRLPKQGEDRILHMGIAYVKLHMRFPYATEL